MDLFTIIVVTVVVGSRLLVPLLIPKYPLPAILACLVIDAVDQTVFQVLTPDLDLSGYQNYDKALDIYYLSVAYLSTFRNWTNEAAFKISQFLFYYRMAGLAMFEATQERALLFIFPNTFEYFFIFVSAVALFYNMKRLTTKVLIGAAAFIWIFIKLPQEYWLHIAKLDTTDFIKEQILGVSVNTPWLEAIAQNLWVIPVVAIIVGVLAFVIYKVYKMLPTPDHKLQWSPEVKERVSMVKPSASFLSDLKIGQNHFIEKIIFSGLLVFIFTNIFPGLNTTLTRVLFGVAVIVILNALVSHMLIKSTRFKIDIFNSFFAMFVINMFSLIFYITVIASLEGINFVEVLFFSYIITLITVLHDRFKPFQMTRFAK